MEVTILLVCAAERVLIGRLRGRQGTRVNRMFLQRGFEPAGPGEPDAPRESEHAQPIDHLSLYSAAKNGGMLLCPRCGNALVAGLEGRPIREALADGLRLVVNQFALPDPTRPLRPWNKGPGRDNPLRSEAVSTVVKGK